MTARFSAPILLAAWLLAPLARAQTASELPPLPVAPEPSAEPQPNAAPELPPPAPSPIDPRREGAEQHRLRAIRFYDARNFSAAREEFLTAYQLVPSHRLLYNLGVVSMALGDSASAYDYFERCLRDGGDWVPPARRAEIEAQLRDLESHVAALTIRVDVHGAELSIDGRKLGVAPLTKPVRLNAGTHEVLARSLGRSSRRRIVVSGGQTAFVAFSLSPPQHRPPADASRTRPWLWVGWASTGVLTAGAIFTGLKALDAQSDYEAEFGRIDADRAELDRLDSRASRWALTTDVLGGAALLSGAVSLYFTLERPRPGTEAQKSQLRSNRFDFALAPRGARATWNF